MKFSQLFRPKHSHPDPKVRLKAIETLSPGELEQKSVLHELAFNDPEPKVNIAALHKLDSFVLWYKVAQTAKNERVAKRALQIIEDALMGDDEQKLLSAKERHTFVAECKDAKLLEKLIKQAWVQVDTELAITLLSRLDNPRLNISILTHTDNLELKTLLIEPLDNTAELQKLLKKIPQAKQQLQIQNKLKVLQDQAAKPAEISKQVRLILAQLLALKEQKDYPSFNQKQQSLMIDFATYQAEFSCLNDTLAREFSQKYEDIKQSLSAHGLRLHAAWAKEQAHVAQLTQVETLKETISLCLQKARSFCADLPKELDLSSVETLQTELQSSLSQLQSKENQTLITVCQCQREFADLEQELSASLGMLNKLPELYQALSEAKALLADFSQLALPNDVSQISAAKQHLQDMNQKWKKLSHEFQTLWPTDLNTQWQQQSKRWQGAIQQVKQGLKADISRCASKLRATDSLIKQGKFKSAMSIFQKAERWFKALPEEGSTQLERQFQKVQDQIVNLKDWQSYIAAPRKPALLDEAVLLANQPLAVVEQAKAIKALREQWNSLGRLDDEADTLLNQAFEEAIETAYTPCREFYAQQDAQRSNNLELKQRVLQTLEALNSQEISEADLAKQLRSLQQQWHKTGEVDFKERELLNQKYLDALAPIKQRVQKYYTENEELKQNLLIKAQALLEVEDTADAVEQAKKLQQSWKQIEHAGAKAEAKLWSEFRQVNDELFARMSSLRQEEKTLVDQNITQVKALLDVMKLRIEEASEQAHTDQALSAKSELETLMAELPVAVKGKLQSELRGIVASAEMKVTQFRQQRKKQQVADIFTALGQWQEAKHLPELVSNLSNSWQQCFKQCDAKFDRQSLTIKMEIVAGVDSPSQDQSQRRDIQLELMAEKLQQGTQLDLNTLLQQWIQQGPLSEQDNALLDRVEALY